MLQLISIEEDFSIKSSLEQLLQSVLEGTLAYYKTIGFHKPWISYLAQRDQDFVGVCSFKGAPVNNRVEVAYFTFPPYEGQGIATEMCRRLIHIAQQQDAAVEVSARTLPETNASTHLLQKIGFVCLGTVVDPEDGQVFEWLLGS